MAPAEMSAPAEYDEGAGKAARDGTILLPGAVVRELGRVPSGAGRDPRPPHGAVHRRRGAERAAPLEQARDAAVPHVVGPTSPRSVRFYYFLQGKVLTPFFARVKMIRVG